MTECVYVGTCADTQMFKIGSTVEPHKRIHLVCDDVLRIYEGNGAVQLEAHFHRIFSKLRGYRPTSYGGSTEWFKLQPHHFDYMDYYFHGDFSKRLTEFVVTADYLFKHQLLKFDGLIVVRHEDHTKRSRGIWSIKRMSKRAPDYEWDMPYILTTGKNSEMMVTADYRLAVYATVDKFDRMIELSKQKQYIPYKDLTDSDLDEIRQIKAQEE